jgi:DNA repair exonuclease SbcCD ATPase subunit
MSTGTAAKFAREVKVLTETVQALANKLKRRDKEVQKLNEAAQRHVEVSQLLENSEEQLLDAKMENQSMAIVVKDLKSSLEKQGMQDNERTPSVSSNSEKKMIDPDEHRKIRSERDSAMTKAGAMAMTLAELRAETDELKDQLAAVKEQLEQQKNADAPHSPSNTKYPPTTGVCPPTARSSMAKSLSLRNLMIPMTPGGNLNKKMGAMWGNRSTHGPK